MLSEESLSHVQGSLITETCSPVKQNKEPLKLETKETRYFGGTELAVVRGSNDIEHGIKEGALFNESVVNSPSCSEEDMGSVPSTHMMADSHA